MADPTDPHSPAYQPEYTGPDSRFAGVGPSSGGTQFGADLFQLYKAGRRKLPAMAGTYQELTVAVHATRDASHRAFDTAGPRECGHRLWMEVRDELQRFLGDTAEILDETGQALVEIADSYVRTDDEAASEFNRLLDKFGDDYDEPTPAMPDPPRPGDYEPVPPAQGRDHHWVPV